MPVKFCPVCKAEFTVIPSHAERIRHCSRRCKGIASRVWANCAKCGAEFKPSVRDGKRAKYCSKTCSGIARRKPERPCGTCGITIREPRQYCSTKCHDAHQGRNKLIFACKTCGSEFRWSPSRIKQQNPTYCSEACCKQCPDWRRRAAIEGNLIQSRRREPNRLETAGAAILRGLGIRFEEQALIDDRFLVDVLVPDLAIVIQWDGDYWHGYRADGDARPLDARQSKRHKYDLSQDAYMRKHGYFVLRFWEHEVMRSPDAVAKAIGDAIAALDHKHLPLLGGLAVKEAAE